MKLVRVIRAVVAELASLLIDEPLAFFGALAGLVVTWLLAHELKTLRALDGILLFVIVWVGLLGSMKREAVRRSAAASP